jgi:hypothetical protein
MGFMTMSLSHVRPAVVPAASPTMSRIEKHSMGTSIILFETQKQIEREFDFYFILGVINLTREKISELTLIMAAASNAADSATRSTLGFKEGGHILRKRQKGIRAKSTKKEKP